MSASCSESQADSTQDSVASSAFYSYQPSLRTSSLLGKVENGALNMSGNPHKIIITRDIGEEALQILEQERSDSRVHVCSRPRTKGRSAS